MIAECREPTNCPEKCEEIFFPRTKVRARHGARLCRRPAAAASQKEADWNLSIARCFSLPRLVEDDTAARRPSCRRQTTLPWIGDVSEKKACAAGAMLNGEEKRAIHVYFDRF